MSPLYSGTETSPLTGILRDMIEKTVERAIRFETYMSLCLYHETYGYYRTSTKKIGREGDFYTSSYVETSMGECLAAYMLSYWSECSGSSAGPLHVVEWGGGEGKLAAHTLDALMRADKQIYHRVRYTMIETSGYHRSIQKSMLAAHENRLRFMTEEEWLAAPPHPGSIVLANELLDAFPVYRLRCDQGTLQEGWVTWDRQAQAFAERWMPLCDPRLHAYLQQAGVKLAEGQVAEVNLAGPAWLERIAGALLRGRMVLIDYGDTAEELYAPHRMRGSLMCYRRHQAHDNFFLFPGEQDITSRVDFSACLRTLEEAGYRTRLMTQREFMVEHGILDRLQNHTYRDPFSPVARQNRAIRQLLLSNGMGELFKVITAAKV